MSTGTRRGQSRREDALALAYCTSQLRARQTWFFLYRPAHLGVGHPEVGPKLAEKGRNHTLVTRRLEFEDGAAVKVEYPLPPVLFADPQSGVIGLQDGSRRADAAGLAREGIPGGVQYVDQLALADGKAEKIG
jgi:hypothetical protein